MSKLSNAVDNDVVEKDMYNKSATNANTLDTSGFVLKTLYNTTKSDLEKKTMMLTRKSLIIVDLFKNRLCC